MAIMYLRCNRRIKDGKEHRYWNIVESKRCAGGNVVQRQVLYLGEINDSQREAWCRVIEAFDEQSQQRTQLALFPAEGSCPNTLRLMVYRYDWRGWSYTGRGNGARVG
jgi:alkylated DNA nucleotide flippase Atl1